MKNPDIDANEQAPAKKIQPRVDIIILTYNGRVDTLECLESLKRIDYEEYRVTVVDNGSSDGAAEVVAEKFPEIDLIRLERNLRFAGGNNLALRRTIEEEFDYALLLNNDTVVEPDFLRRLVELAESNPGAGLAAPKMRYFEPSDTIWFAGGKMNVRLARMRHIGIGKKDLGQFEAPAEMTFLSGACLLIKRGVLLNIGLLDEDFFLYGEDQDYCFRALNAGWRLLYQPQAVIYHKVSRSTPTCKKLIFRYRSWLLLMKKHTSVFWRPLQFANLILEFIPLMMGFLLRKIRFRSGRRG